MIKIVCLIGSLCALQQAEAAAGAQQNEAFEIDQWILDFANLFREQLNIEPDKHLDLTNMGWDKLQAALDSAVQSDQAPAIFDAAADKFQEVSAHGPSPARPLAGPLLALLPQHIVRGFAHDLHAATYMCKRCQQVSAHGG